MQDFYDLYEHYIAVGDNQQAHIMLYRAYKKALDVDNQTLVYHYGMILYQIFSSSFLEIRDQSSAFSANSIFEPIDWPSILVGLGRALFLTGKSYEAEQIADKLIYCAQRYEAPILQAHAHSLSAMFLLLREELDSALQRLVDSDKVLNAIDAPKDTFIANMSLRMLIYIQVHSLGLLTSRSGGSTG